MYISKLSIKNFRNFADPPFEIALKPFTLILGENKVGKTNLLAAVSLMTTGEDHSIDFHFSARDATEMLKKIGMIYGANPIPVARNGLGRNNLLYVALVLSQLAKATDLPSANEEFVCFRFVGIEEPEAHLHPHLQDHLANNIEEV
jgi:predicted ATP-dependent endonuclease of OLD family